MKKNQFTCDVYDTQKQTSLLVSNSQFMSLFYSAIDKTLAFHNYMKSISWCVYLKKLSFPVIILIVRFLDVLKRCQVSEIIQRPVVTLNHTFNTTEEVGVEDFSECFISGVPSPWDMNTGPLGTGFAGQEVSDRWAAKLHLYLRLSPSLTLVPMTPPPCKDSALWWAI